eukprot:scaffold74075_cov31-Tisochrysis_lutea.AAC.3
MSPRKRSDKCRPLVCPAGQAPRYQTGVSREYTRDGTDKSLCHTSLKDNTCWAMPSARRALAARRMRTCGMAYMNEGRSTASASHFRSLAKWSVR